MKQTCTALLLALCLVLTGCAASLDRSYEVVVAHPDYPSTEEDSSMIRVETYQELVNAVLYFVSTGADSGNIRLVNYTQDVDTHLAQACLEVSKDDPLGAYAVDYIKYSYTRAATTYEATIDITYRRTAEQVDALVSVMGSSAIRRELQNALNTFSSEIVLSIDYFNQDEEYIRTLLRQAYYDTPTAAMGLPSFYVNLYPDSGYQRIIEISIVYPLDQYILLTRQNMVITNVGTIIAPYVDEQDTHTRLVGLLADLPQLISYTPGDSLPLPCTIWDALVSKKANSEGLALALSLLCTELEIPHTLVEGWLDGAPHYWIVAEHIDGTPYHIDLSRGEVEPVLYTPQEFADMGYLWEGDYPGLSIPVEPLPEEPAPDSLDAPPPPVTPTHTLEDTETAQSTQDSDPSPDASDIPTAED